MGWNGWDSGYYYSGAFNTDKGPETDFEKQEAIVRKMVIFDINYLLSQKYGNK